MLDAATSRLIPGPGDDPRETTPGRAEANVVRYLDIMLWAFSFSPPKVHAGGPWSNRAGGSRDFMANFVPLDRAQNYAWQQRIANLRTQYTTGIALLDQLAGGDFTSASKSKQNSILSDWPGACPSPRCCSVTPSRACTPSRSTAATRTSWVGRTSPGRGTSSRAATPTPKSKRPKATRWPHSGIIGLLVQGGWAQAIAKMGGKGGVNGR